MTKQVHIHIHRTKARDAGEGEGKWITLSPSGTHVKVDGKGEIVAGPKGMAGKKPSELSEGKKTAKSNPEGAATVSAAALKHVAQRPHQSLIFGSKPGNSSTVNKTEKLSTRKAKSLGGFELSNGASGSPKPSKHATGQGPLGEREQRPSLKGSAGPATTKTESYSWGKLTKVGNVNESAIAHPKDREQIATLADGDSYQYTDEQGKQWKVTRHGEQAAFYKANAANPALVAPIGEFQDTPHDPTGMAHAGIPQGTAAVQARIDAKKAAGKPVGFAGKASAASAGTKPTVNAPPQSVLQELHQKGDRLRRLISNLERRVNEGPLKQRIAAKADLAEWRAQLARHEKGGTKVEPEDWSSHNGNWEAAKKGGKSMVENVLSAAKTPGDKTNAMLALKNKAAEAHRKGSYLGAVVVGLVNDYFERLR